MRSPLPLLTSLSAIIGPVVTLIGLIQSRGWLAGVGLTLACTSIIALVYARAQRQRVTAATVEVEGLSIDALNATNLRRRISDRFMIQTVEDIATIEGLNLDVRWRYAGYCRAAQATAFEYSVDSEPYVPFPILDCSGFDLKADPGGTHRIQPLLIGPDGISKKLPCPFLSLLFVSSLSTSFLTAGYPAFLSRKGH